MPRGRHSLFQHRNDDDDDHQSLDSSSFITSITTITIQSQIHHELDNHHYRYHSPGLCLLSRTHLSTFPSFLSLGLIITASHQALFKIASLVSCTSIPCHAHVQRIFSHFPDSTIHILLQTITLHFPILTLDSQCVLPVSVRISAIRPLHPPQCSMPGLMHVHTHAMPHVLI